MSPLIRSTSAAFGLALLSQSAFGQAVFDFNNNTAFDNVGIGASMTVLDPTESVNVTLTSDDIIGQDGSLASDGVNFHQTNIQFDVNSLGINDATNPDGAGSNSRDFDPGEGWVISFDVAVKLIEIDFSGMSAGESFTISSTAFSSFNLADGLPGDTHDLLSTPVPAGTQITIQFDGSAGAGLSSRISYLTVAAEPAVTTGSNLVWAGADGDLWDTGVSNFTGDATQFTTGDNVDVQTAGGINIATGGVTAGLVSVTAPMGTVTFGNGNVTSTRFEKSGDSILLLDTPVILDTGNGVTSVSGGTLRIADDSLLDTGSLLLSGGATLEVDVEGALDLLNGLALGTGGGVLDTEAALSIDGLGNGIIGNSFIKDGSGDLTFTGVVGTETTGPIDLDIAAGTVKVEAGSILNIGGDNSFEGDLSLDGGKVEFHASAVTGAGKIISEFDGARIDVRFQGGQVTVANEIVLTSSLVVEAPTNGNSNSELLLDGPISGPSGLIKKGNGLVVSSGLNTYLGNTDVEAGILRLGQASLADASVVSLGTFTKVGMLDLTHGVGDTVKLLFIDGEQVSPGTYGSSAVTGTSLNRVDDVHFAGEGWLVVTDGPVASDYAAWNAAGGFNLTGAMGDDDDGDGVTNEGEYAFGLDPTDPSSLSPITVPLEKASGTLTYTRRNTTLYNTNLSYRYFSSTTLNSDFAEFTPDSVSSDGGDPVESVTITLPTALLANPKLFVQIIAE